MPPDPDAVREFRRSALAATLRQCRMFVSLSREDLGSVADICLTRTLDKGEMLFREGELAEGFYVMQSGQVSIFRLTPSGREQVICIFRPSESFAEATLATTTAYPANAVALEPSQVIVVQRGPFRELIFRKPELALHMLGSMSLHLKHLVQLIQDYKGRQIEGRLADWLLNQLGQHPGTDTFALPMTKRVLAAQLGVTSETLSRTLARFRDEHLIRVDGPRVQILKPAGLRAYLDAET